MNKINIELSHSAAAELFDALTGKVQHSDTRLPPVNPDGSITPDWLMDLNQRVRERNPTGRYPTHPDGQPMSWATPIILTGSIIWAGTLRRDDLTPAQRESIESILRDSYGLAVQALGYRPIRLFPWDHSPPQEPFALARMVAPTNYAPGAPDPVPTLDDLRRIVETDYALSGWL